MKIKLLCIRLLTCCWSTSLVTPTSNHIVMTKSATDATPEVSAVSLKLPTFWASQPLVWFAQAESQFSIRGITQETTQYHYVVASLDQETAVRVLDLIQNPPQDKPYTKIKKRLTDTFSLSEYKRANQLLNTPSLGDQKPSALMDQMLALLRDHEPCFLFKQIFLSRLPDKIRAVLIHSDIKDCRELALAADRLYESFSQDAATANLSINKVGTNKQKSNKNQSRNSIKDKRDSGMCFYHAKFGDKAHRCIQPCNWSGAENEPAGSQ